MFVYLAGPVDGVDEQSARGWRLVAVEELLKQRPNIATYSPPHAISVGAAVTGDEPTCEAIIKINQVALSQADFVIANLNGPSFGTPVECLDAPCPVIGFASGEELKRMQGSIYQHRFAYLAHDLEEAVRVTLQLFKESEEAS